MPFEPLNIVEVSRPVPPADLPVSVAEVREHLLLSDATERDDTLRTLILGARDYVENVARTYLVATRIREKFRRLPCGRDPIALNREPVQRVFKVSYIANDATGTLTQLDPTKYTVEKGTNPVSIHPAIGFQWPMPHPESYWPLEVEYEAGPACGQPCRSGFKNAVLLLLTYRHEFPSGVGRGATDAPIPSAVLSLLMAEGIFGYA